MIRTEFPKARKPMRKVSKKRAEYRASDEGQAALTHMGKVKQLPCCICLHFGMTPSGPSHAHHPIHGRYSARKSPDLHCIPLCEGHHQGNFDTTKIAIHREPSKWRRLYGPDTDYIAGTLDAVEAMDF